MPNLDEIIKIQNLYPKPENRLREINTEELKEILIEGEIGSTIKRAFIESEVLKEMLPYFTQRIPANVVLMFVDIVAFSKKTSLNDSSILAEYLDKFYDFIIPCIQSYGGVVDKILGDGVIVVFGLPFLNLSERELLIKATNCSNQILKGLEGTEYESKIALHSGEIRYYQNKTNYKEFTMIGTPITELYRLESVSENNALNYYIESPVDLFINNTSVPPLSPGSKKYIENGVVKTFAWDATKQPKIVNLNGVAYKKVKSTFAI